MQPLTDLLRGKTRSFLFPTAAKMAFINLKRAIANIASLSHHHPSAPLALSVDASDVAVGAVLQQQLATESRYSAFGKELLAVYLDIRHFRYVLEGRDFIVFTYHKPLTYALRSTTDRYSPRETRHLEYIAQFTTDIRHISGIANPTADALSRINATLSMTESSVELTAIAAAQADDPEREQLRRSGSLKLKSVPMNSSGGMITCDTSLGIPRPVIPLAFSRRIFDTLHNMSHPGIRSTVTQRFVWRNVNRDWSKVHRHKRISAGRFAAPDERFYSVHVDLVEPLSPSGGYAYILTCVDRVKRWPEAIPIPSCPSETVARAFLERWVTQFANGLIEHLHRKLESSLSASNNPSWHEVLPPVLLGLRNTLKANLHTTPAQLVYGCSLR
ncbi:uncharacterized protein DEA37_0014513 [Paragonimus westermani]|uniref:Reverse transcriptase RNase H-like domain-containing protein n=1 Tax=Paragonimus westermani TaxID=34504 RepID=A0A5J4P0M6_9TREM|nr:uncharacterized protein DEA37_0014513 [Paragonimus westermani]